MNYEFSKKYQFKNKIIIVDGQPGCGKTLLSQIISSFEKVELFNYSFELEFALKLHDFEKLSADAAKALCRMFLDHKLYQSIMGRETNFRFKDLSGVFNSPFPLRYLKRIFQQGDAAASEILIKEKPILNIATHDLLSFCKPLFDSLGDRLYFIEVVRHPLYMLKQQIINMENLLKNPRDIQLKFTQSNGEEIPYFARGWENKFQKSNNVEKAIYSQFYMEKRNSEFRKKKILNENNYLLIPFEKFVLQPELFLKKILLNSKTEFSNKTNKILKKQNVPRKKIEDGMMHASYLDKGWERSKSGFTIEEEMNYRRKFIINKGCSTESLELLDNMCEEYLNNHKWY